MEVIKIKIDRYKEVITGLKISEGVDWIMIAYNDVDYVLDGIKIINRKYIKHIDSILDPDMKGKILNFKYRKFDDKVGALNLDNTLDLFRAIDAEDLLISIHLHSADFIIVGKIVSLSEGGFTVNTIDAEGEPSTQESFKFDKVRVVDLHNDYLYSLELYMRHKGWLFNEVEF